MTNHYSGAVPGPLGNRTRHGSNAAHCAGPARHTLRACMKRQLPPAVKFFKAAGLCVSLIAAGGVCAQSSVTLYGIADAGLGRLHYEYRQAGRQADFDKYHGFRSGGESASRIGFQGKEALDGHTSVLFNLEAAVDLGSGRGKSNFWNRYAYVGISSEKLGTLTLGRQKDVPNSFAKDEPVKSLGKYSRAFGGKGTRRDGLVNFVTPEFSGTQVGLSWSRGDGDALRYVGVAAAHDSGPMRISLGYGREKRRGFDQATSNWMLLGSYDFKVVKVVSAYGQDINGKFNAPGGLKPNNFEDDAEFMKSAGLGQYQVAGFKSRNYYLGATAPVGVGTLGAAYSRSTSNMSHFGFKAAGQSIVAALYSHPLSKRTGLYVYGSRGTGIGYVRELKAYEFGVGMRHKF